MNCIWILHHITFICFYFMINEDGYPLLDDTMPLGVLGIIACLTLVLGALIDIIEIIVDLIKWSYKLVGKLHDRITNKDEKNTESIDKNVETHE